MQRLLGRVLLVDDDAHMLAGLKNRLWSFRHEWRLLFVGSGEAALAAMECEPFDAIIADMRMPLMDGAQLLTEVAKRHPRTTRIILSGQADASASTRALAVAHRFLSKPCPAGELEDVLAEIAQQSSRTEDQPPPPGHAT